MSTNTFPQFLICGAARTATTWLCHALLKSTQIYFPYPLVPEPKFFAREEEYAKGFSWYCEHWFAQAKAGQICGEKSTAYLETSGTAEKIHAHLPQVKLIFLLRNPVDRALSNYYWSCHNGIENESFERAIELEKERELNLPEHLRNARPFSYFDRGHYAKQLQPYFDLFPKEQILCLKTEDIDRGHTKFMHKVLQFLEVPMTDFDYSQISQINVATNEAEAQISTELRIKLNAHFTQSHTALVNLLGEEFKTW